MHVGLSRPISSPPFPTPDIDAALLARRAEEVGFESILYGEHPICPIEDPGFSVHTEGVPLYQDTLVSLSRATAMTERIKVGGGVFLMPEHNPVAFAKQLATLDYYSGGDRLLVGLGTGWSYVEITLLGGRFERRWDQMREAVTIMKRLWNEQSVEFEGEFFTLPPVFCYPQPATRPNPPILLGGMHENLIPRIIEYADGWMAAFPTPETMAAGHETVRDWRAKLGRLAIEKGRDPKAINITVIVDGDITHDVLRRYEDAGADRLNITLPPLEHVEEGFSAVERIAEKAL